MTTGEFNPYQAPAADLTAPVAYLDPATLRPVPFEDLETEPRFWPRVCSLYTPKGVERRVYRLIGTFAWPPP